MFCIKKLFSQGNLCVGCMVSLIAFFSFSTHFEQPLWDGSFNCVEYKLSNKMHEKKNLKVSGIHQWKLKQYASLVTAEWNIKHLVQAITEWKPNEKGKCVVSAAGAGRRQQVNAIWRNPSSLHTAPWKAKSFSDGLFSSWAECMQSKELANGLEILGKGPGYGERRKKRQQRVLVTCAGIRWGGKRDPRLIKFAFYCGN